MTRSSCLPEVRERAIRLVADQAPSHSSHWAAVRSVADKSGRHAESLRYWMRRRERDTGQRPGLNTSGAARLKEVERENRELRCANAILLKAFVHLAQGQTQGLEVGRRGP
jgi:transposase-like protein